MAKEYTGQTIGSPGGIIGLDDAATATRAWLVDDGKWCSIDTAGAEGRFVSKDSIELHAGDHVSGAVDELDGDVLDIDWNPTNYTPTVAPAEVTSVDELTAHLAGIDTALGTVGADTKDVKVSANDTTAGFLLGKLIAEATADGAPVSWVEIGDGGDEDLALSLDGDVLNIDFTPANYTPDVTAPEASDVDDLAAHLKGIDTVLASAVGDEKAGVSANDTAPGYLIDKHIAAAGADGSAVTYAEVGDGGDEDISLAINGDHVNIDWNPTNYTPTAAPAEAADVDDLTAHLAGIDAVLADVPAVPDEAVHVHEGSHITGSTSYRKVAEMVIDFDRFPSADADFHFDQVVAVAGGSSVRLQNITDVATIGSLTGTTTTGLKTFALTTLPTGIKKVELQQKKDSGGGTVQIAGGLIVAV
jgi:hypothetical protein